MRRLTIICLAFFMFTACSNSVEPVSPNTGTVSKTAKACCVILDKTCGLMSKGSAEEEDAGVDDISISPLYGWDTRLIQ